MILPSTFVAGLALMILAMLCLGSWAVTLKRAGKLRYELYYFDFAAGFLLCAIVAAFTLGSLNQSELTFQENFLITGYRKIAYGILAGVLFNLGNTILAGGVSVAGVATAVPISLSLALAVGTIWDFAVNPHDNALLIFGGVVLIVVAVIILAFAYSSYRDAVFESTKKAALQLDPRSKEGRKAPKTSGAALGIFLGIVSGILLGIFGPLAQSATEGDNGVAPYGIVVLIAFGLAFSTVAFSPFTINFPLAGAPARVVDYFKAGFGQHLKGIIGGILLCGGMLAMFVVAASPAGAQLGPVWTSALGHGAPVIALLWGAVLLREFKQSSERIRMLLWASAIVYGTGLALISVAPLYRAG